jgi:thiol-disulfide isomerase/thioredoxin
MRPTLYNSRLLMCAATLLVILSLVVFAAPRLGQEDVPELPRPDGSGEVPEMILSMVTNPAAGAGQPSRIKLSGLRGRVILLDMFSSQCPHCRDHAPHVIEVYNQYKARGFTMLGLATDKNDNFGIINVRNFLRETKITYPTAFITTEVVAYYADPRNHQVPQMVLFGADGKMVKRWIGWSPTVDKEMRAAIEGQLGKALAPSKALAPEKAVTPAPTSKSGEKAMSGPARRGGQPTQR